MFIDLNAPDNSMCEERRRLVKLWQGVLIQAIKTACESAQDAYDMYVWHQHEYGKLVCEFALIDYGVVNDCLFKMQSDNEYRRQLSQAIYCYKSKSAKPMSTMRKSIIQQELFT